MSKMHLSACLQVILLAIIHQSTAKKDKALYCAVCRALVEEVNGRIGDVDPKKVVETGSFRVDPHGNQKLVQKQYARSEVHLFEIFEDVCQSMTDHINIRNEDGSTSVVRRRSRSGVSLDTKNVAFTADDGKRLKLYCDSLVEEHEEEMITLFRQDSLPFIESAICGDIASACTEEEFAQPIPKLSEKQDRDNLVNNLEEYLEKEDIDEDDDDYNVLEHSETKQRKSESPAAEEKDEL